MYISIAVLFLTKRSQRTSTQHLPFQSLNSNTRVGHERCSRFIKITTKTKVNCCSTLDRFEQTLHLAWVFLWPFYKKQGNVPYGIGSISVQLASHVHNAANHVSAKSNCQSYFLIDCALNYFFLGKSASYSWYATKRNHKRLEKTCLTIYEIVIKDNYLRS